MNHRNFLLCLLICCISVAGKAQITKDISSGVSNSRSLRLWYTRPANPLAKDSGSPWESDSVWLKALPVGNGFLGAMVFGGVYKERIQLNEKSLWSGSHTDYNNPKAFASLGKIRQLLFEGKYKEANALTAKTQVCKGVGSGRGLGADDPYGCYQTLGDLWLDFGSTAGYSHYFRELDLNQGVVKVSYQQRGISYYREVFASYPDRALVVYLTAGKKGALNFNVSLTRPERFKTCSDKDNLMMFGTLKNGKGGNGMQYAARVKAIAVGGKVTYSDSAINIRQADTVELILTAATNYKQEYPDYLGADPKITTLDQLNKAASKPFDTLWKDHEDDYTALFDRVCLNLAGNKPDTIPTDIRLKNQEKNPNDLLLQEIYFQYGRYLLISSSRQGSLPANLQGIWANKIQTPWNGDYHLDINLQMNYWPADITNLSDCFSPFTNLVKSLVKPGEVTAAVQYHAKGWCVEPITNVWGYTSPGEGIQWGMYVAAGGWLSVQLWDHYTYTLSRKYLENIYPVMLQSARFYLDWLVKDPKTGKLVSGPSTSPENSFIAPDGSIVSMSMGTSHDQEILHALFTDVLKAAKILNDTTKILKKIHIDLQNLAAPEIGSDGRLMEWNKEFKETDLHYRHVAHLFMLYPGTGINPITTHALAEAARKTLIVRGDAGPGWSLAWKINFWARLRDGEHAYRLLKDLLRLDTNYKVNMSNEGGTYPNLFDAQPPFQIDGNLGAVAGMAGMLMQSYAGEIALLPAIPKEWEKGDVRGLRARGGFIVDIAWDKAELKSALIKSLDGQECKIRASVPFTVEGIKGKLKKDVFGYTLSFKTKAGKIYPITLL